MFMYRILENKDKLPHTLFHGVKGSRRLPLNEFINAEIKEGRDGSGQKKLYKTGFHVVKTKQQAEDFFMKMFRIKKNRVVCRVEVGKLWRKEHSRHEVYLSDTMKIHKKDWNNALRIGV